MANDSDPDNDPLMVYSLSQPAHGTTLAGGSGMITYTPAPDFLGQDSYTYTITDGHDAYATATVTVTVSKTVTDLVVFFDSFENGLGNWSQDSQNDWFSSTQRAVDGIRSAEVDGLATNAQLISVPIDLQGRNKAVITFSWYIERGLDNGEFR